MEAHEESSSANILVICRFRPLNEKELEISEDLCVEYNEDHKNLKIISQYEYGEPLKFGFDHIFDHNSKQVDVYNVSSKPIVEAVMQGFNGTVFAYGQTSSGKTYTMSGIKLDDNELMGIIPRMILTVFEQISNADPCIEYQIKVSYCEIYMEKIRDLLEPSKENMKIHEDKTRGIFIAELTEVYVSSASEVHELMKVGLDNRKVGHTDMNEVSSRSHSLFSLVITQTNKRDYISKTGKLYLVDLAGSEKVGKTNVVGKRLEEAKNINKSLTMLGLVIYSLTDGKSTHIPYRDSKLTRVLQDSLGGNSKTSLIITCSPSPYNEAETLSTLRFGMRAKAIKNKPKVNREYTVAELKLMLAKCREEIAKRDRKIKILEESLSNSGGKVPMTENKEEQANVDTEDTRNEYEEMIAELEDTRTKLAEEVKITGKLRIEIEMHVDEINHSKAIADVVTKQNQEYKQKIQKHEKVCEEKENVIERLTVTKESLEKEIHQASQKIIDLEQKLNEKNIYMAIPEKTPNKTTNKSGIDELKNMLKKEKEMHMVSEKDIFQLRHNLNEVINKKCPEVKVQEIIREEISRKEKDKWSEERKNIMKDLQARVDRIIELEMALDDANESYKNLESYMSEGERALKRKTDTLERNLEQLTLMYHNLINQKSQISVEKTLAEKKLSRVNDKIKNLEDQVSTFKNKYEESEQKFAIVQEELVKIQNSKERKRGNISGNIKRTIHGGFSHERGYSLLNQSSFTSDDMM
ncbi:hypothetical protein SteCoe_16040 [Stentor coeruleus]|uniref:Kinesin-like protein n=1 Tax=Stentor coeruleus TaxID=5963 RepID=A0A1R2C2D9_9CILI|nr:hypothetical protein SteCoe_16040 [Stentor coeruleus]